MSGTSSFDAVVVGAGVAGLFCATALADAGLRVAVLEARACAGGRARSWDEPHMGLELDIGPHVVSTEHVNFLRMLRRLGTDGEIAWQPQPMISLLDAGEVLRVPCSSAMPPFHGLPALPVALRRLGLGDAISHLRVAWQASRANEATLRQLDGLDALTWLRRHSFSMGLRNTSGTQANKQRGCTAMIRSPAAKSSGCAVPAASRARKRGVHPVTGKQQAVHSVRLQGRPFGAGTGLRNGGADAMDARAQNASLTRGGCKLRDFGHRSAWRAGCVHCLPCCAPSVPARACAPSSTAGEPARPWCTTKCRQSTSSAGSTRTPWWASWSSGVWTRRISSSCVGSSSGTYTAALEKEEQMDQAHPAPGDIGKQRVEALSDGLYAIALTLLVLELKLPSIGEAATNADLLHALRDLMPKLLTWFLSFWVMAVLWLSQVRVYHLVHSLSRTMVRLELLQLACVSLMPFSTALIGEHGQLPLAAVIYAGNMLAITLTGALRTRELLHQPHVHIGTLQAPVIRTLKMRSYALPACAATACGLGFFFPGWNMLAMLPMVLIPSRAHA